MKKSADQWFAEYGESHRNLLNEIVHWICVPMIVVSLLGMLWAIPMPATLEGISPLLNVGMLAMLASMVFYAQLSKTLAVGMLLFFLAGAGLIVAYEHANIGPLWIPSVVLFVVAWIGQFIGHVVEGKKPSFFKDLQFLLIGPAWLLHFVYRRLKIPY